MTQRYALGSLQGGVLQPIQQHTWDVTYVSEKPNNTIFTLHPFFSGKELAMFFPEEQKFLSDEVNRYHLVYTNPNKWNSSSPYEQTFQQKNTIIVLYNLDEAAQQPHIDGFFPKNLDERKVHHSGWIFCRAGPVFIAVYPLKRYEWIEESINWRLRSNEKQNGVVVEVGSSDEDGSYEAFKTSVALLQPEIKNAKKAFTVQYRTRHGDRMSFTFSGERILNGSAINFNSYKFFSSPFVQSERGSGVVRMTYRNAVRELDFKKALVREWQQ
jgi:hypothetical protein